MNYDHLNQVHEYWNSEIFPHFIHRFPASSFDDYLKKFAYCPSGKWLRDAEKVKLARVPFAMIPLELVKKYKPSCVTYNVTLKPEDGHQRAIYQISPTLHFEAAFWIWIEHKVLQSYAMMFVCYNDEKEYSKFLSDIYEIRRSGNTEDKPAPGGFAGFAKTE